MYLITDIISSRYNRHHSYLLGLTIKMKLCVVGKNMVFYTEEYGSFHTSTVVKITKSGDKMIVETGNSIYHFLKL